MSWQVRRSPSGCQESLQPSAGPAQKPTLRQHSCARQKQTHAHLRVGMPKLSLHQPQLWLKGVPLGGDSVSDLQGHPTGSPYGGNAHCTDMAAVSSAKGLAAVSVNMLLLSSLHVQQSPHLRMGSLRLLQLLVHILQLLLQHATLNRHDMELLVAILHLLLRLLQIIMQHCLQPAVLGSSVSDLPKGSAELLLCLVQLLAQRGTLSCSAAHTAVFRSCLAGSALKQM